MFRKEDASTTGKVDTLIGGKTRFKGDLRSSGAIRVDGQVEGSVTSDDTVIIGETGAVTGPLRAKNVMVGGYVEGNVTARNKVELLRTARVQGDVSYGALVVEEGVILEGRCSSNKKETGKVPSRAGLKPEESPA